MSNHDPGLEPANPRKLSLHEFDRWEMGNFQVHETGYLPRGIRWHYDQLRNPFWRFYYNSKAGSYIEEGGETHPLEPDAVMVIPENTSFNSRNGDGVPHLWIHFSPPLMARFSPSRFTVPLNEALAANIRQLQRCLLGGRSLRLERQRIFHSALALVHCCFSQAPLGMEPPLPPILGLILENIERSLVHPPSNRDLAQQAGMSVEGFGRWFKRYLGLSPARYVGRRRIREACRLLALTDRSIEVIAESIGFANRHHFSRVFRQHTGCAPAQFRLQQSGEPGGYADFA